MASHTDLSARQAYQSAQEEANSIARTTRRLKTQARYRNINRQLRPEVRTEIFKLLRKNVSLKEVGRRVGLPHGFIVWIWRHNYE